MSSDSRLLEERSEPFGGTHVEAARRFNILDGLLFMFGHDFDVDDIVYIKGVDRARIIRQTPTKTVFHILETDRKLVVPNTDLYSLRIEKPMPGSNEGKDI